MQVKTVNFLSIPKNTNRNNVNFSGIHSGQHHVFQGSKPDSFEKQNLQISFTGLRKNSKNTTIKKSDLSSSLENIDIKGLPFLLGVVASTAMIRMGNGAQELLIDNDGYDVTPTSVKSDLVNIDTAKGIIKFAGAGIELKAEDYDIADIGKGIFKNYDGSVDIDLLNNKFIDYKDGIIVDPANRISGVLDGKSMHSIAIPSFGSGYPTCPWDGRWLDMPNNIPPEEDNAFEKATKFIKGLFNNDTIPDTSGTEDIFGNNIMMAKDGDGDVYLAQHIKGIEDIPAFARFAKNVGRENAIESINDTRMQQIIEKNYPKFATEISVNKGGSDNIYEYIKDQAETKKDKIDKLKHDADINNDNHITFKELLKFVKSLDQDGDGNTTMREILNQADVNSDNHTTLRELLDLLDLNGDGKTTITEIVKSIIGTIIE